MATADLKIKALEIGKEYAEKVLAGTRMPLDELMKTRELLYSAFADGYINGYDAKAEETPDIKPTATRREVAQMTEAQLAVYAQRLFDAGITGMDLDGVLHNLEVTQIWLKQDLRSQDASLVARCELFNITA